MHLAGSEDSIVAFEYGKINEVRLDDQARMLGLERRS